MVSSVYIASTHIFGAGEQPEPRTVPQAVTSRGGGSDVKEIAASNTIVGPDTVASTDIFRAGLQRDGGGDDAEEGTARNTVVTPDSVASTDIFRAGDQPPAALGVGDGGDGSNTPAAAAAASTPVDGNGMWRSWTRVFAKPESACLDLLDNCFDAALKPGFGGRVEMESYGSNVVSIQNNSDGPIKRLADVLTVYRSSKNSALPGRWAGDVKDSIGENGVGLKHGCATLSDCSVVLARDGGTLEIGVIAKALQTPTGVCLPSSSFPNVQDASRARGAVRGWLASNPAIAAALGEALGPAADARAEIGRLAEGLFRDGWEGDDRVFLLVLCGLRREGGAPPRAPVGSASPARTLLHEVRALLPESYINLPSGDGRFDFAVGRERVEFAHWQRRLVELTRFRVSISADDPLEALPEEDWDRPTLDKHDLSIYCGFDAQRVERNLREKKGTSACALYVYSCRAGRLVEREPDARHLLGLSSSGVDYTQGLTVIVEDHEGRLPLTPTKDGIAWSERTNGEVHRRNLLAWAGAAAQFFWTHHRKQFEGKGGGDNGPKQLMKKTIRSFALDNAMDDVPVSENMADAQFTEFEGIKWNRIRTEFDDHWKIRRKTSKYKSLKGLDTLFPIIADRIQRIKEGRRPKPQAASSVEPPNKRGLRGTRGKKNEGEGENEEREGQAEGRYQWQGIPQNNIHRVSMGVLHYLRDKDKDKLFEMPVLEEHPEVKEQYLKLVEKPMDFRTIEGNIESYTSISKFHQDLVLTFDNCIAFSGAESPYGKAAQQMLDSLDDAFEATDITQVALGVLSYFRDLDEKEFFEIPVIEQNPEVTEVYLDVISNPMDFRTIEETRVNSYTSIAEIRQDFVRIFQNCIQFNGANSVYSRIAQTMLDSLEEAFENIMLGKKRRRKNRINYKKLINHPDDSAEPDAPHQRPGRKRIPYVSLQKKLRDAEKQIQQLKKQLAARDGRIVQLEEKRDCKLPARKQPRVELANKEKQDSKAPALKRKR